MPNDTPAYFAHPTAVLDAGCRIGAGTKIWHFAHLMPGCELGENCSIGQNVMVADGVRLGRNVKVQNNVSLYTGVECADDVFLGPSVVFTNVRNPRSAVPRRDQYQPTVLEQGVSVGANTTIVCGVRLGQYAFVGAGSVVTRDVAPYALVYGNPARQHGWMSAYGHRLHFDAAGRATCPESGEAYQLTDGLVASTSPPVAAG
ncbi:N-acetyltransferase [Hymenobacter sp. BT175]|uniref:acyltransferase n=1 Tax=Hymenobacter translucens TaxID=2886507 RepID=UPI001D0E3F6B|nr:acyltransferase [Hymenobacter translucens]MCC2545848.1 N-acetyltransferase [Hymenobacter translucens]